MLFSTVSRTLDRNGQFNANADSLRTQQKRYGKGVGYKMTFGYAVLLFGFFLLNWWFAHRSGPGEYYEVLSALAPMVRVDYGKSFPVLMKLSRKLFSFVDPLWENPTSDLRDHVSVRKTDAISTDVDFLVMRFFLGSAEDISAEEVHNWGIKNGYRAATLLEALAFVRSHPAFPKVGSILVLGTSAFDSDGYEYVPVLGHRSGKRRLMKDRATDKWREYDRFLLVRR